MKLVDALKAIQNEDPDALLTKVLMWKVGDLISAIESGDSGHGFAWSFDGADYVPRMTVGLGYHINRPHPDGYGGEEITFWVPSAKQLGIIGGSMRTEAKKKSAIENGRKGGRPHYFVQLYNAINPAIETTKTEFRWNYCRQKVPLLFRSSVLILFGRFVGMRSVAMWLHSIMASPFIRTTRSTILRRPLQKSSLKKSTGTS